MSSNLFNHIKIALCNHDTFWNQRRDATGLLGLLPGQKMTDAIRMLAYGLCTDQCAELTRMGESTTLKCMKKWCEQIIELHKNDYLRSLNVADLSKLLCKAEQRGFPGMKDNNDGMYWEWKICPTASQCSYSGCKGHPTII
ncbi:hypothetical protein QQ045_013210 [Rhodiola kirilowii]